MAAEIGAIAALCWDSGHVAGYYRKTVMGEISSPILGARSSCFFLKLRVKALGFGIKLQGFTLNIGGLGDHRCRDPSLQQETR